MVESRPFSELVARQKQLSDRLEKKQDLLDGAIPTKISKLDPWTETPRLIRLGKAGVWLERSILNVEQSIGQVSEEINTRKDELLEKVQAYQDELAQRRVQLTQMETVARYLQGPLENFRVRLSEFEALKETDPELALGFQFSQKLTDTDAEKKPGDRDEITVELPQTTKPWSIPQAVEIRPVPPSPKRETFKPIISDINLEILNRIINDPEVSVESVLADLGTGLNKPVTSKEAIAGLKEAVNFLFLKAAEGNASDLEKELWDSIRILTDKGDPARDLREFHALLEQWFEGPKKPQPVQGIAPETIEPPARQASGQSPVVIDAGPFPNKASLKIVTIESATLAQNLLRIMPDSQYPDQALALAIFVTDLQEGKIKPITNAEIMNAAESKKALVAQNAIRQRLAQLILRNPQAPLESYKWQWARDAKEMIQFLGAGGATNFARAIDDLPEFERAMVLAISSLTLLTNLEYLNLDECNEESFVSYIRNASFIRNQSERDDSFALLINTLVEKADAGSINLYQVIDGLLELDYVDSVFDSLLESAQFLSFQDKLIGIFSIHFQTAPIAKRLQQRLDSEEEETLLPRRIIEIRKNAPL